MTQIRSKQINIARELLDMMYTLPEFARELFVDEQTIHEWIGQGLPHEKDDGEVWIHGVRAGEWILSRRKGAQ